MSFSAHSAGSTLALFTCRPTCATVPWLRTDRSRPGDQHCAAATDLGALDTVERHRRRLDQRALLVVDTVGQLVGIVVVDDRVFAHAAPAPGQADAAHP